MSYTVEERELTASTWRRITGAGGDAWDLTSNFNTPAFDMLMFEIGSCQFVWTGVTGAAGTFQGQASLDGVNWSNLTDLNQAISDGDDSGVFLELGGAYRFFRVVYTAGGTTAGTAKLRLLFKTQR